MPGSAATCARASRPGGALVFPARGRYTFPACIRNGRTPCLPPP
ncbi:hypothetical protein NY78_0869 [Desulfovibrio sp. TomC]|nr:hypothetical protein NY78_0869 [Desulfovibrio sp. TomC]